MFYDIVFIGGPLDGTVCQASTHSDSYGSTYHHVGGGGIRHEYKRLEWKDNNHHQFYVLSGMDAETLQERCAALAILWRRQPLGRDLGLDLA